MLHFSFLVYVMFVDFVCYAGLLFVGVYCVVLLPVGVLYYVVLLFLGVFYVVVLFLGVVCYNCTSVC